MDPRSVPDAALLLPRPFRVARAVRELRDTVTLELRPADGGAALDFLPGQFTMLYAFGVGEVPVSISGAPLVQTIRAVGPVTKALCALKRGDPVGVRGPYGTPWPVDAARGSDVAFVAGGIGLAPLRPAIRTVLADRAAYGRVSLLVGVRTPRDLLFPAELRRWRDLEVRITVDSPAGSSWKGDVGVVTRLISRAAVDHARAAAFVCGPEIMMRFAAQELLAAGVPSASIHLSVERNMKCAVALCGHCQLGPEFVCKDGPVFPWPRLEKLMTVREL
jgi:NAD(P)H-flavin reductase